MSQILQCNVVATSNVALSEASSVDGVSLSRGMSVLLVGQTNASENGVWVVGHECWTRDSEARVETDFLEMTVLVAEGAQHAHTTWRCTSDSPLIVGMSEITFAEILTGPLPDMRLLAARPVNDSDARAAEAQHKTQRLLRKFAFFISMVGVSLSGCSVESKDALETLPNDDLSDKDLGQTAEAITVTGMQHYCSMTWPGGGWALTWNANDPCTDLVNIDGPGGTIQRAGVYSVAGVNSVVVQCTGHTSIWVGVGDDPLNWGFSDAVGHANCTFTNAPKFMAMFDSPFFAGASITAVTGFDFAKAPYSHLNVHDFGQTGSTSATLVDWKGRDKSSGGFEDDHDAHDWEVPEGTAVRAVAAGTVRQRRNFDTGCSGSHSPIQGEVYLDHVVNRSPSTYNEKFVSGYFHMIDFKKADGTTLQNGEAVTKDEQIGHVGWVGCSSQSHLHFAVLRMSNVAAARFPVLTIDASGNDGWKEAIEPFGFDPPQGFDPWGWMGYASGVGALSIGLWNAGQAPPTGSW